MRNHKLRLRAERQEVKKKIRTHEKTNDNQNIEKVKKEKPVTPGPTPQRRRKKFECQIETKNLPKNFGKAIVTFI